MSVTWQILIMPFEVTLMNYLILTKYTLMGVLYQKVNVNSRKDEDSGQDWDCPRTWREAKSEQNPLGQAST